MTKEEIKKFKQFLREKDCAAKFYNNVRLLYDKESPGTNVEKYLKELKNPKPVFIAAFAWSTSIEGGNYWLLLSNQWEFRRHLYRRSSDY